MTAPPTSVPHALARRRAQQIGNVRYQLVLRIDARARMLRGRGVVGFELLHARDDVQLDWRPQCSAPALDAALRTLRVNARAPSASAHAGGHLHIRARDLVPGPNRLEMAWCAPIATAGAAIARFVDPLDGSVYVHTLFVPDEASCVFPCFDQPDLKAVFELTLGLPRRWRAIANAPIAAERLRARARVVRFAATEPISTYVFAFAAGPWIAIDSEARSDPTRLWGRRSQRRRLAEHAQEILRLNRAALRYCSDYLAHPFPFAKYDLIAIPQLPYRGMEHAGATFLDEDAVLLRPHSGAHARFLRAQLICHETAHQWMGDLVTMRWFDDLWFKEGHANFLAYRLAQHTWAGEEAELEFMALRATAYRTDCGPGATALHHPLADLADAKAAYGSMVYAKAPAVLRTLERTLGASRFRRALRDLVRRHAFGAIDWRDWVHACERAGRRSLTGWARAWLLQPGVAQPRARTITELLRVDSAAYAIPRPTRSVLAAIPRQLARTHSGVQRLQLWEALSEALWDARLHPRKYVAAVMPNLAADTREVIVAGVLQNLCAVMESLLAPAPEAALRGTVEEFLWRGASAATDPGTQRAWLDAYIAVARTAQGTARLHALLAHRRVRSRQPLMPQQRVRIAAALIARGALERSEALDLLGPQAGQAALADLVLAAAQPDAAAKRAVFERYLADAALPEAWILASLAVFNHPAHHALTRTLLTSALRALPGLVRSRKIFFTSRWLAAFIAGQCDRRALASVHAYAQRKGLSAALRLKVLEAGDRLERIVRIRAAFHRHPPGRDRG